MKKIYLISLLGAILSLTACNSTSYSSKEEVSFNSMIAGVDVYVDGILMGKTPCTVALSVENSHNVELKKEGFKQESYTLNSTPDVPLKQLGALITEEYPKTLSPKVIFAEMKPECLPIVPGKTAFETYTENYLKVDALKKFGVINEEEYKYIIKYMHKFYSQED